MKLVKLLSYHKAQTVPWLRIADLDRLQKLARISNQIST
jgi:hypothetical protein